MWQNSLRRIIAPSSARSVRSPEPAAVENPEFCEYQLTFQGLGNDETKDIVDYLKKFSGYSQHEVLERNKCRHVVAYLGRIARSKLESNYRRMFGELRMRNVRLRFDTLRVEANKLGYPS